MHAMHGMPGMPGPENGPILVILETHPADAMAPGDAFSAESLWMFLVSWPFMLTAMMAPLLIPALRHVYVRSLPSRRRRTLALLTAAYAAIWSAGGLILFVLAGAILAIRRWLSLSPNGTFFPDSAVFPDDMVALAIGVVVAVAWQFSPLKQRCLNRHHAHPPMAAFGRDADVAALRFGGMHAFWCLGSCWALMLLPLLFDRWHLVAMAVVTLWIWAEVLDPPVAPAWRPRLPVTAARLVSAAARQRSVTQLCWAIRGDRVTPPTPS
ncbi:DUF2182 domain-containing protein [Frankia sp. AiPa1]|uniref:copper chaperone n=1 Tax=Frankia sp. AiPa1 TaxID=573492 RepID=UPI00202B7213|nr:DUF2182 domain-containing protein [Frankia sp. AiPa1]MCL9759803.1 DUF2182 domain-containing protein [Frankia sp. AiPa1]